MNWERSRISVTYFTSDSRHTVLRGVDNKQSAGTFSVSRLSQLKVFAFDESINLTQDVSRITNEIRNRSSSGLWGVCLSSPYFCLIAMQGCAPGCDLTSTAICHKVTCLSTLHVCAPPRHVKSLLFLSLSSENMHFELHQLHRLLSCMCHSPVLKNHYCCSADCTDRFDVMIFASCS